MRFGNHQQDPDRLKAFSYVLADKAPEYRAVMRLFLAAKARFVLHLRPEDVAAALAEGGQPADPERSGVDGLLDQLCEWGNLEKHPDTTEVSTVEDFYRPRYLFQLTREGEAAERAIAVYHDWLAEQGELQAAALSDIHALLAELAQFASQPQPDAGKVHRTLTSLRSRFDELTSKAQMFVGSLQRTIDLHGVDIQTFLAYKQTLIDYLERFIGELVVATADIAATLERIDATGVGPLLELAAHRDLADALSPTDEDYRSAVQTWQDRWRGLRAWFISGQGGPSQAEVLRARARSSIPALLSAVAGIHDRRSARSDRSTDLRTLARWFAETDSEGDAHRLWRAAFGLSPARHLRIDDATLELLEAQPVPPSTSWLAAPPLEISPRLRKTGRHTRNGRPTSVIDRSREKALLAQAAEAEARQIAAAQDRLATGRTMRLSEIGRLEATEFDLFLDLLGEVLAARGGTDESVTAASSDGTLHITLTPTGDQARAVIQTSNGEFSGQDYFVRISNADAIASC